MMSGGSISEQKLNRHLNRVKAQEYTPIDRTDRLLGRLCKEGYLVRHRDVDSGAEVIEYHVGPRGKIEVGVNGVSGMVREVYGFGRSGGGGEGEDEDEDEDEEGGGTRRRNRRGHDVDEGGDPREAFEQKLRRSLGIRETGGGDGGGDVAEEAEAEGNGEASRRGGARRNQRGNNGEDSDY